MLDGGIESKNCPINSGEIELRYLQESAKDGP